MLAHAQLGIWNILLNDDISQLLLSMRCSRNILARVSCESPLPPMFNVGSKQRAVRSDNIFATPTCSRSCKSTLKLGGRGFCFSVSCFFSIVFVAKGCVHAVAKYCRPTVGFPMLLLLLLLLLCCVLFVLRHSCCDPAMREAFIGRAHGGLEP